MADEQAPVIGGADRIKQIQMRAGIGAEIDVTATVVSAGDHRGNTHVEVGIGLSLAVHAGKAIYKARDDEFPSAVNDSGAFGDGKRLAGTHIGYATILHN